jgi:hypothetical protein
MQNQSADTPLLANHSDRFEQEFKDRWAWIDDRSSLNPHELAAEVEKCCDSIFFELLNVEVRETELNATDYFFPAGYLDFSRLPEGFLMAIVSALSPTEKVALLDFYAEYALDRLEPIRRTLELFIDFDKAPFPGRLN